MSEALGPGPGVLQAVEGAFDLALSTPVNVTMEATGPSASYFGDSGGSPGGFSFSGFGLGGGESGGGEGGGEGGGPGGGEGGGGEGGGAPAP
jgi:hypothetical protein